jgi:hypothetical protein
MRGGPWGVGSLDLGEIRFAPLLSVADEVIE